MSLRRTIRCGYDKEATLASEEQFTFWNMTNWPVFGPNFSGVSRKLLSDGDPGLIRTADTQFRKLLLYPSELQPHVESSLFILINYLVRCYCFTGVEFGDLPRICPVLLGEVGLQFARCVL